MAHIVGPEGEEIYTDEYGRVKVQFPWHRFGRKHPNSYGIVFYRDLGGGTTDHIDVFDMRKCIQGNKFIKSPFPTNDWYDKGLKEITTYRFG